MEADLVQREQIPYTDIPAAGVHGVGLRSLPRNLSQLWRGVLASRRILKEFKPDVILFTGGYVAAPMAVAARSIPTLLYVPDIEPGLALKFLASRATCIALTAEESRTYFSSKARVKVTGYPTRPNLTHWDAATGRKELGLQDNRPTLLVFGGSKGARSINRAVAAILPELLSQVQIVHITGKLDWDEMQTCKTGLAADLSEHYHIYPYLHEMGVALASADLAVSRAGASSLGEYPLFGLPAILAPYPYAWRYQKVNADHLVKNGAALLLDDEKLTTDLLATVQSLFADRTRLTAMSAAMRSLATPQAAQELADLVEELAGKEASRD
jgi:UDP-N-acetylglucosamine--N-acetylmuramyl-(pentapeptide) pyrophosphoryl-undecaprenol N-acetylglucosamine transferase